MQVIYRTKDSQRIAEVEQLINDWNSSNATISVQSSGSTGTPQSFEIEKTYMRASATMTGEFLSLKEGATALLCMSTATIGGKMMVIRAIELKLTLIVTDISSTPLEGIDMPIDFAAMVPMQVQNELHSRLEALRQIKQLIIGGGSISAKLANQLIEHGMDAYQTFGMTETISHVAMRKISDPGEIYKALPSVEFSSDERGCLIIDAPLLGVHQLRTNDIVELVDKHHFKWLGRADFVINSGGIKLHPEQLENALSAHISLPFFCAGLPDESLGEKHVLCVEGSTTLAKEDLAKVLERFEIPKEIYFFDQFNRTKSQKVDRLTTLKGIAHAKKQVL